MYERYSDRGGSDRCSEVEGVHRPEMKNAFCSPSFTQLPSNCQFLNVVFFDKTNRSVKHPKPKNRDQDPEWSNQVPLRRARGVLPFCLKQRKSNFPLGWKQSPSWLTSCWKTGLWLTDIFPSYSHTKWISCPFSFLHWKFLILFLRLYPSHCAYLMELMQMSSPCGSIKMLRLTIQEHYFHLSRAWELKLQ